MRVIALTAIVPVTLAALAVPASAVTAPTTASNGVCKSLFNAKKVTQVAPGAYVMPGESDGTLLEKYSLSEGETVNIKACVIYDIDRDGRLDKGEPTAGVREQSFDFPDDGDGEFDYSTDVYRIQVPQSPPYGQLCWRERFTLTRVDGSKATSITATCFPANFVDE